MKLSTKIFIVLFVVTLIPSLVLGKYVFEGISATGTGFKFNFNGLAIAGLVMTLISNIFGTILYIRFLRTQKLSHVVFFSTVPLSIFYGFGIFIIAGISNFGGDTASTVQTILNVSQKKTYNSILWAVLLTLVYIVALFFIYAFICRPVQRLEQITHRLGDGKVREESFEIGKSKQFKNIESSLEKINYNYKEKENLVRQADLEAQKFIPRQFLKFLGKSSISELELGNQVQKRATTFFCDIVSSTKVSSTLSLEENFNFINSYLNIVSPIIRKYDGFVDKYMGDGILAVFSRPERAIECASAVCRAIEVKNKSQKALPDIDVRIAIHTGEVVFGIVGEEARKSPTIISDVVNLASKMEDINQLMGTKVIISKDSLNEVPAKYKFDYRYIGSVSVQGGESTSLFESLEVYSRKKKERLVHLKRTFEEGVRRYNEGDFLKAKQDFKQVLSYASDDKASYVYFNRACDKLGEEGKE